MRRASKPYSARSEARTPHIARSMLFSATRAAWVCDGSKPCVDPQFGHLRGTFGQVGRVPGDEAEPDRFGAANPARGLLTQFASASTNIPRPWQQQFAARLG